jgi:hypothetical protein
MFDVLQGKTIHDFEIFVVVRFAAMGLNIRANKTGNITKKKAYWKNA